MIKNLSAVFCFITPEELLSILAQDMQKRRLEKGFSREALTELSGVPTLPKLLITFS